MKNNDATKRVGDVVVHKGEQVYEYMGFGSDTKVQLTLRLIQNHIAVPTKAGHKPSQADCLHFAMLCKARGLNPWEGDCFMIGYDTTKYGPQFSLITAEQALLKRAELHPDYDGMEYGVIVQDETGELVELPGDLVPPDYVLIGGWAKIYSKTKSHFAYVRIDLKAYQKPSPFWQDDPGGQIAKCARAKGLRLSFPTKLGGLYLREEMGRIERGEPTAILPPVAEGGVAIEVPKKQTKTESLADKLKGGEQSEEDIAKVMEEVESGKDFPGAAEKDKPEEAAPEPGKETLAFEMGEEETHK